MCWSLAALAVARRSRTPSEGAASKAARRHCRGGGDCAGIGQVTPETSVRTPDIAVLISYGGDGGVERMVNNLVAGMLERGYAVDVLVLKTSGGHFQSIPQGARVVRLGTRHTDLVAPLLIAYLRRARPPALLVAKDRAGRAALLARRFAGVATRVVVRLGNTLSEVLAGTSRLRRALRYRSIRRLYPAADGIVAVSRGVADDFAAISGVERDRIHVIANPVITNELEHRAREPVEHAWLADGDVPVILAAGRLTAQKDFPTLLEAFARVRRQRRARLLILGEGEDRTRLERQVRSLGLTDVVDLPGFVTNPYAYMATAHLFVLSSAWEGSPNVLTEALYLGVPVVATDCRSGPREVLQEGRYGRLVPVGDSAALGRAMAETLEAPLAPEVLREAVAEYTQERSTARYLERLAPPDGAPLC